METRTDYSQLKIGLRNREQFIPSLSDEILVAIVRITHGNFRLLNRLLTQVERILEINRLQEVTAAVLETARENLVIGQV